MYSIQQIQDTGLMVAAAAARFTSAACPVNRSSG